MAKQQDRRHFRHFVWVVGIVSAAVGCAPLADDDDLSTDKAPTGGGVWEPVTLSDSAVLRPSLNGSVDTVVDYAYSLAPGEAPDGLLILLEGGGACFSVNSCAISGYPESFTLDKLQVRQGNMLFNFDTLQKQGRLGAGILNRDKKGNPFANYDFVFVPYVDKDVHAGVNDNREVDWQLRDERPPPEFHGEARVEAIFSDVANVAADLGKRLQQSAKHSAVLVGASAGGIGTYFHAQRFATHFASPGRTLTVINLSGLLLANIPTCLQQRWINAWGLTGTALFNAYSAASSATSGIPRFEDVPFWVARQLPEVRFAIATKQRDRIMAFFYKVQDQENCDIGNPAALAKLVVAAAKSSDVNAFTEEIGAGVCTLAQRAEPTIRSSAANPSDSGCATEPRVGNLRFHVTTGVEHINYARTFHKLSRGPEHVVGKTESDSSASADPQGASGDDEGETRGVKGPGRVLLQWLGDVAHSKSLQRVKSHLDDGLCSGGVGSSSR